MSVPVKDEPEMIRSSSGAILVRSSASSTKAASANRRAREDRKRIYKLENEITDLSERFASLEKLIRGALDERS